MQQGWFKRHFIPHQENQYQPHVLRQSAVVGMMCLIIITFAVSNIQSYVWHLSDWMVSTILPAVIVTDTNVARDKEHLPPLVRNDVLDKAATLKAEDMAKGSYFAHYSPTGISPWYWFKEAGYTYVHAGENLAVHFTDSGEVVDAWLASPAHRANIMDAKFAEIGIGTARGTYEGYDTIFVVQLFGTPAAVATHTNTANTAPEQALNTGASAAAPVVAGAEDTATETVDVTDSGTVVVSSYLSTSTGGVPATIDRSATETTPPVWGLATKPHLILQVTYIIIGLLVAIALTLAILIEIRRQHPTQIACGIGLFVLMLVLFYAHISISGGVIIV